MNLSVPEGFSVREATAADVEPAAAVLNAEEVDLRGHSDWRVDETTHIWRLASLEATGMVETTEGLTAAVVLAIDRGGEREACVPVQPDCTRRRRDRRRRTLRSEARGRRLGRRTRREKGVAQAGDRARPPAACIRRVPPARRVARRPWRRYAERERSDASLRAGRHARAQRGRRVREGSGVSRLRAKCPDCKTFTAVALGPEYECHACGRVFRSGL